MLQKPLKKWALCAGAGFTLLIGCSLFYCATFRVNTSARADLLAGYYSIAYKKIDKKARAGNARSQNALGNLYYMGLGVRRDYRQAGEWYKKAAINGSTAALVNMGVLHFRGEGVRRDLIRAFAWLRLAKKAGRKNAKHHLLYLSGINLITPNMMQKAKVIYATVADLTKENGRPR